jgi:aryl-alcohol dehydrogenase-like predicted oxidoreductase
MGSTGTQVSRLCLGCMSFGGMADWTLNEDDSLPIIKKAAEAGINFFDTADIYSRGQSEEILGRALKTLAIRRDESVVATKVFNPMGRGPNRGGLSRKHIMQSIDASLSRLQMDYVDLYQIHRFDYHTPIEETIEALDEVVKSGKALYIGASSMFAYQFSKYLHLADQKGATRFSMMQNHYNLLYREEEREMMKLCQAEGVGVIPWSPLARGRLARLWDEKSTTTRGETDQYSNTLYAKTEEADRAVVDRVTELSRRRNIPQAQIALAWMLSKPYITAPIVGATKPNHIADAVAALSVKLSSEDIARLEEPYVPHAVAGFE